MGEVKYLQQVLVELAEVIEWFGSSAKLVEIVYVNSVNSV